MLLAALGCLVLTLGSGTAGCASGPTDDEGRAQAGGRVSVPFPPDPVKSELMDACAALREGGFEGTYMFRRTDHSQHYRCEESGLLQPIQAREFRRARCRCPRVE